MKSSDDILRNLILLSIYKKERDETIKEVVAKLDESGAMKVEEAEKILKELQNSSLLSGETLTFTGVAEAKKAEEFFKL
jgi:predicted metal-dependent peptidase